MFKKKQAMKRGGAVKKRGGGMMGPKKKRAGGIMKKRGGGMMEKMMGGGMMGPKKKMAKGGAVAKAKSRKPSGRLTVDDVKRVIPTGRSAAAKKVAGKSKKAATFMGKFKQGKGNPAGKDLSMKGQLSSFLKRRRKSK
jgi:hypothetical protein